MARYRPRTPPKTPTVPVTGQLNLLGGEPWQVAACACWPPNLRGCQHCKTCDTCGDCGQCAGRGCAPCECDT